MYYYVERKHNTSKQAINVSIAYFLGLLLCFVPISFVLTLLSGRGKVQINNVEKTSLLENIVSFLTSFYHTHDSFLYLMVLACLILCGFIYYFFRKNKISKKYYIQTALLCIGIIGIIGFCAIRVPGIWFEVILIFCALLSILLQYKNHNKS